MASTGGKRNDFSAWTFFGVIPTRRQIANPNYPGRNGPVDRLSVARAMVEDMAIIADDEMIQRHEVRMAQGGLRE
jgi:hypothetical protein